MDEAALSEPGSVHALLFEGARTVGMQAVVVRSIADVRRALSRLGVDVERKGS